MTEPDPGDDQPPQSGGVGFAAVPGWSATGLDQLETADRDDGRPTLCVPFPRVKVAIGALTVTAIILVAPWLIVPLVVNDSGVSDQTLIVACLAVLIGVFGWFLVLLMITAARGGSLSLTHAGVCIDTGLGSVLIPWNAISGVTTGDDGARRGNGVLRLSLRRDLDVTGWPWPVALSPVLIGSSRRRLRILSWWFQPVALDAMVATIRHLVRNPDQRPPDQQR